MLMWLTGSPHYQNSVQDCIWAILPTSFEIFYDWLIQVEMIKSVPFYQQNFKDSVLTRKNKCLDLVDD